MQVNKVKESTGNVLYLTLFTCLIIDWLFQPFFDKTFSLKRVWPDVTLLCAGWLHAGLWIPLQVNVQIADKRQRECFRGGVPLSCSPLSDSTIECSKLSARNKNLSRKKKKKKRERERGGPLFPPALLLLTERLAAERHRKTEEVSSPGPPSSPHLLSPSSPPAWPAEIRPCAWWKHRPTPPQLRKHQLCASHSPLSPPHLSHLSFSQPHIHRYCQGSGYFTKWSVWHEQSVTHTHTHGV